MRPDLVKANLEFLKRITLQPAEIPAYTEVCQALVSEMKLAEVTEEVNDANTSEHQDKAGGE
jgi:hypothetical protein